MSTLKKYSGIAYKYRDFGKFDAESKDRIKNMFLKKELYFANALKFNDPFECNPAIEYKPQEFRRYLVAIAKKKGVKVPSDKISEYMQHYKNSGFNKEYQKYMAKNMGICCMSKRPDIVTQWAYYADNGKGFCIGYEVGRLESVGCIEVEYKESRPTIDLVKFQKEKSYRIQAAMEVIGSKAVKWAHEEEVRLFAAFQGKASIPESHIKSIVLGASIEDKKAEWLVKIAKKHIPSIEIKKATLCDKEFLIKVV